MTIVSYLRSRKNGLVKYYKVGIIMTVWNLFSVWLLVDVLHITGLITAIILSPVVWVMKPLLYYLTGFAKKDLDVKMKEGNYKIVLRDDGILMIKNNITETYMAIHIPSKETEELLRFMKVK